VRAEVRCRVVDYFPVFMDLRARRCLVVGGGEVAARKARLLLRAGAHVVVVAPELGESLTALLGSTLRHEERAYRSSDLDAVALVIAATDDREVNRVVARDASARNVPVNAVDDPELCSVIVPALVDRSPVLIAVGTAGSAPVLARLWRARIEAQVPARLGELAAFSAAWRAQVRAALPDVEARRQFWEQVFEGDIAEQVLNGQRELAGAALCALLAAHGGGRPRRATVYLIGAGPNDPELMSFRAMRFLQSADLVLSAPDVCSAIVELARRDATHVRLTEWPVQASLDAVLQRLSAAAGGGRRTCVLAPGDAFRQPAGRDFIARLEAAGLPNVMVPAVA